MRGPYCEVIGCGLRAVWVRVRSLEGDTEYLCGPHFNELKIRQPDESSAYRPLVNQAPNPPGDPGTTRSADNTNLEQGPQRS